MNMRQEKILVATLCGLVIALAAGFAVQPALATSEALDRPVVVTSLAEWDHHNLSIVPAQ